MSEQQAEPTSGETGSVSAGPDVFSSSDAATQPAAAQEALKAAVEVESPHLVPGQGDATRADAPKVDTTKPDATRVEASKPEAAKPEATKPEVADAPRADAPRAPGKIMIMSSGDRSWDHNGVEPEVESEQAQGMFGKRRVSALAAVVALAAVAGALGGALATAGVTHFAGGATTASSNPSSAATVDKPVETPAPRLQIADGYSSIAARLTITLRGPNAIGLISATGTRNSPE